MKKILLVVTLMFSVVSITNAKTIRIAIGHQSKCTDTYSAGTLSTYLVRLASEPALRWQEHKE